MYIYLFYTYLKLYICRFLIAMHLQIVFFLSVHFYDASHFDTFMRILDDMLPRCDHECIYTFIESNTRFSLYLTDTHTHTHISIQLLLIPVEKEIATVSRFVG